MIELLTSENWADFRQRYCNTVGWLNNNNKKILVYISKVSERQVDFVDVDGGSYCAYADTGVSFEFIPVMRGWHNALDSAYLLMRRPAKQYHRGISDGNTLVYKVQSTGLILGSALAELKVLDKIFTKGVPVTQAHNEMLQGKRLAFAINKYFAVSRQGIVWFYDKAIGEVKDNKITLQSNIMQQELSDGVRRAKLNYEVSVKNA